MKIARARQSIPYNVRAYLSLLFNVSSLLEEKNMPVK